jgi:hypothetical protein
MMNATMIGLLSALAALRASSKSASQAIDGSCARTRVHRAKRRPQRTKSPFIVVSLGNEEAGAVSLPTPALTAFE